MLAHKNDVKHSIIGLHMSSRTFWVTQTSLNLTQQQLSKTHKIKINFKARNLGNQQFNKNVKIKIG